MKIEKLVYGGFGIGREEGKVYFVPYVLPDEEVVVSPIKEKKEYIEAKLKEIIEENPDRTKPECEYFGLCGGCDYLHIKYQAQLKYKKAILQEIFQRIAKIDIEIDNIIPSENQYFYRNKTQLKVDTKSAKIGFYKKNSNEVVEIDKCLLVSEEINPVITNLKKVIPLLPVLPKEIHIFSNQKEILLKFIYKKEPRKIILTKDRVKKFISPLVVGFGDYVEKDGKIEKLRFVGQDYLIFDIEGFKYKASVDSFFQVNKFQIKNLINIVLKHIDYDKLADLYCGVGLFTIPASKICKEAIGVEISYQAIKDANFNKKLNNLKNVKFYPSSTEKALQIIKDFSPDIVIIDPPRAGLTKEVINQVVNISNLKKIIYVSCDPATLARDVKLFIENGFKIKETNLIDMFPNTYHIESIIILER